MSLLGDDPPTENANPTVVEIENDHFLLRGEDLLSDYPDVAAISAEDLGRYSEDDGLYIPITRTTEDVAVMKALADASVASHGRAVSLLKNIGLKIDENYKVPLGSMGPSMSCEEQISAKQVAPMMETDAHSIPSLNADEVFEIIRNIQDPEHPLTLEQLGVVSRAQVEVHDNRVEMESDDPSLQKRLLPFGRVNVRFTPTIPHCSMATQIGLCLKVKLDRSLPKRFKSSVKIEPGTHASENAINKQLGDKERVCAALENKHLLKIVNRCISNGMTGEMN